MVNGTTDGILICEHAAITAAETPILTHVLILVFALLNIITADFPITDMSIYFEEEKVNNKNEKYFAFNLQIALTSDVKYCRI